MLLNNVRTVDFKIFKIKMVSSCIASGPNPLQLQFSALCGTVVSPTSSVYISDNDNNRIKIISD